ncbi:GbsR/MarR family transcriptional regulator [Piscibacillus salipiscarius]|uniref:HTH-type transcriptional regulator n=1 Tax=Piscibacillus salipiscarius TaxID=299480 RepID=A0ABW5QCI7_9BACI|nr:helix-turn-helix domain-containing protein [Piscibacillus salipiscarius]
MDKPTSEQFEHINNQLISEFSKTLEMFSLNQTEAQLFVTLFFNDEPMTLDDMKDALGRSKTAMSNATRTLLDFNLIERVFIKGARKDLYQAKKDLYDKFMKTYVSRWLSAIDQQLSSLDSIQSQVQESNINSDSLDNKLTEAIKFHRSLEEVFKQISQYDQ